MSQQSELDKYTRTPYSRDVRHVWDFMSTNARAYAISACADAMEDEADLSSFDHEAKFLFLRKLHDIVISSYANMMCMQPYVTSPVQGREKILDECFRQICGIAKKSGQIDIFREDGVRGTVLLNFSGALKKMSEPDEFPLPAKVAEKEITKALKHATKTDGRIRAFEKDPNFFLGTKVDKYMKPRAFEKKLQRGAPIGSGIFVYVAGHA